MQYLLAHKSERPSASSGEAASELLAKGEEKRVNSVAVNASSSVTTGPANPGNNSPWHRPTRPPANQVCAHTTGRTGEREQEGKGGREGEKERRERDGKVKFTSYLGKRMPKKETT